MFSLCSFCRAPAAELAAEVHSWPGKHRTCAFPKGLAEIYPHPPRQVPAFAARISVEDSTGFGLVGILTYSNDVSHGGS